MNIVGSSYCDFFFVLDAVDYILFIFISNFYLYFFIVDTVLCYKSNKKNRDTGWFFKKLYWLWHIYASGQRQDIYASLCICYMILSDLFRGLGLIYVPGNIRNSVSIVYNFFRNLIYTAKSKVMAVVSQQIWLSKSCT